MKHPFVNYCRLASLAMAALFASNSFAGEAVKLIVKMKSSASLQAQSSNEVDSNLANRVRHLKRKVSVRSIMKRSKYEFKTVAIGSSTKPISQEQIQDAIESLKADPNVEYVERDSKLRVFAFPNDTDFNKQWHLRPQSQGGTSNYHANVYDSWVSGKTGDSSMIVAVIDTGVQYDHPDLAANMWKNQAEIPGDSIDNDGNGYVDDIYGYNFIGDGSGDPMDDNDHGTHCAGIIGAKGNNGKGVSGANFNVSIMALKFLDAEGSGDTSDGIKAIDYAVQNGAKILSMSFGSSQFQQSFRDAIEAAKAQGVLVVAAAGNESENNDGSTKSYPASYDNENIISVAALDPAGTLSDFSNFGKTSVDIAAPGRDIFSTIKGSTYKAYSGTSMATPLVAGVAALVWSENPFISWQDLTKRLIGCSRVLPSSETSKVWSGSTIDAGAAMAGGACASFQANNPIQLAATKLTATKITLGWANGGKTESYKVAHQTGTVAPSSCASGQTVTSPTIALTGLSPLTDYSFRVCATNSKGGMSSGVTLTLKTKELVAPPAPMQVKQDQPILATHAFISWANGGGNTSGFRFASLKGTGPVSQTCSQISTVLGLTELSKRLDGMTPSSQYSVRICAENEDGLFSSPVDLAVTTQAIKTPEDVKNLRVLKSDVREIELSWDETSQPLLGNLRETYIVKRAESLTPPATCDGGESVTGKTYKATNLKANTGYSFRVCVDNQDGGKSAGVGIQSSTAQAVLTLKTTKIRANRVKFEFSRNYTLASGNETVLIKYCRIENGAEVKCRSKSVTIGANDRTVKFKVIKLKNKSPFRFYAEIEGVTRSPTIEFTTKRGVWPFNLGGE